MLLIHSCTHSLCCFDHSLSHSLYTCTHSPPTYCNLYVTTADPYQVHVGSLDLRANIMIRQVVEVVQDYDKYNRLIFHLNQFPQTRVIIFAETKKG